MKRPPSGGDGLASMSPGQSPDAVARRHDLADDLAGGQVAHQLLGAGVAEGAGQRAADLRGDAQRAAVLFRDVDHLDLVAGAALIGRQAQQPLAGAVIRDLLGHDLGAADDEGLLETFAQVARDVGHFGEVLHAAMVDPVPDLPGPHAPLLLGDAGKAQGLGQSVAGQADQGGPRVVRDIARRRFEGIENGRHARRHSTGWRRETVWPICRRRRSWPGRRRCLPASRCRWWPCRARRCRKSSAPCRSSSPRRSSSRSPACRPRRHRHW